MGRDVHELATADVITDGFVIGVGKDLGGRDRHRLRWGTQTGIAVQKIVNLAIVRTAMITTAKRNVGGLAARPVDAGHDCSVRPTKMNRRLRHYPRRAPATP